MIDRPALWDGFFTNKLKVFSNKKPIRFAPMGFLIK